MRTRHASARLIGMKIRRPTPALEQRIRAWIDDAAPALATAEWPQNVTRGKALLLLHIESALFAIAIAPDGGLFELDLDHAFGSFDPLANGDRGVNAVALASHTRPELTELLPQRTSNDPTCPRCAGSGEPGDGGRCRCNGLGWIPSTRI